MPEGATSRLTPRVKLVISITTPWAFLATIVGPLTNKDDLAAVRDDFGEGFARCGHEGENEEASDDPDFTSSAAGAVRRGRHRL